MKNDVGVFVSVMSFAAMIALAMTSPCAAQSQEYEFVNVVDDSGVLSRFRAPVINDLGHVAFRADENDAFSTIYKSTDTGLERVARTGQGIVAFGANLSMNDFGIVAFTAAGTAGSRFVYAGDGGTLIEIASNSRMLSAFATDAVITNDGQVSFWATFDNGEQGILTGDGTSLTTILDTTGQYASFGGELDRNEDGTIAFAAELDSDSETYWQTINNSSVITTIASTGNEFDMLRAASMNVSGRVAFGTERTNSNVKGIYQGDGGAAEVVVESGPDFEFFGDPDFNNDDTVVVIAHLLSEDVDALIRVEAGTVHEVVRVGSPLFQSTVTELNFRRGLNNLGEIAFEYALDNGTNGIAIARPIGPPQPSPNYGYLNIVDSSQQQFKGSTPLTGFDFPAINDNLIVAFRANDTSGTPLMFTGSGGPLTTIADVTGQFSGFGSRYSINNNDLVAFQANLDSGGNGIFTSDGTTTTTIADPTDGFTNFGAGPDIVNNSFVAFQTTPAGVYVGNGNSLTAYAQATDGFATFNIAPAYSNSDIVAFRATTSANVEGVFTSTGDTIETIADTAGPYSGFSGAPGINTSGDVIFQATLDTGEDSLNIFSNGTATTIVDNAGDFDAFNARAINDDGNYVFLADLDDGSRGIFFGLDPISNKLIQTGDAFFGSTVTSLNFFRGLNNDGDVAFAYGLEDGRTGIAVAVTPKRATLTDASVTTGVLLSGDVTDLQTSDDSSMRARSVFGFLSSEPNIMHLRVDAQTILNTASSFDVMIEGRINNPGGSATVSARNHDTGMLEVIGSYSIGTTEETITIEDADGSLYIQEADGSIELELKQTVVATFALSGFVSSTDLVDVIVSQ